jgi:hypothetical protein
MSGYVYRNLRTPVVATDAEKSRVIITFNGDEDTFVMLQMAGSSAEELSQRLQAEGFGKGKKS